MEENLLRVRETFLSVGELNLVAHSDHSFLWLDRIPRRQRLGFPQKGLRRALWKMALDVLHVQLAADDVVVVDFVACLNHPRAVHTRDNSFWCYWRGRAAVDEVSLLGKKLIRSVNCGFSVRRLQKLYSGQEAVRICGRLPC